MKKILMLCFMFLGLGMFISTTSIYAGVAQEAPAKETKTKKKTKKMTAAERKEATNKAMDYEPEKDPNLKKSKTPVDKEKYKMKPAAKTGYDSKAEVKAEAKEVKADTKKAAKKTKAEVKAEAKEMKADTKKAAKKTKAEIKSEANEVKGDTKKAAKEVKAEAKEVKADAKSTAKEAKADTKKAAKKTKAKAAKATAETKATIGDDKKIGKDAKGRQLYEGPRGGHYYINSNGNKEYVTQDNK